MSDDVKHWKSKYLHSLQRLKEREELWVRRVDMLRRSLMRTSIAAEGVDRAVDSCMHELRDLLRRDALDVGLSNLVPRLEKALLEAERRREERVEQIGVALRRITEQLRELPGAEEHDKDLRRLVLRMDSRVGQLDELHGLLSELAELQAEVTRLPEGEQAQSQGLMQRLFGSRSLLDEQEAALAVLDARPEVTGAAADAVETPADVAPGTPPAEGEPPVEPAGGLQGPEPRYSQVAARIESTLTSLLDDLRLPGPYQDRAQALRARIRGGLNWYELIPVLDDLAELLRGLSCVGQEEFQQYLAVLSQRLGTVQECLAEMSSGHGLRCAEAQALDGALREQMGGLHSSMRAATELAALKQLVEERLSCLAQTVDEYQARRQAHEAQTTEQLRELNERLSGMERAAEALRGQLAEQQRQASLDSLTGVANRAAWNDRLEQEFARWQRYGGELLLAVLDVDHFKRINDQFGHAAGDRVLKIIAGKWQQRLRKTDFIARYGGEEFVMLLPATPLEPGCTIVQELLRSIEECPFHFKGQRIQVTVSAGVTAFSEGDDAEQAFERADQALYRAKEAGRNRLLVG